MVTFIKIGLRAKALRRLIKDVVDIEVEGIKVFNIYVYLKEKNDG